jgi:predicted pyridoxine 5'-phosphate oxidase superfamily flavin-nucleotide-binding protein
VTVEDDPDLAAALADPSYEAKVERAVIVHVEAFDWNCPQHITPRFTAAEIEPAMAALRSEVETLRAENVALRKARAGPVLPD